MVLRRPLALIGVSPSYLITRLPNCPFFYHKRTGHGTTSCPDKDPPESPSKVLALALLFPRLGLHPALVVDLA